MNKCDMCGTPIENSKCECGTWISNFPLGCILVSDHQGKPYWVPSDKLEEFSKEKK
jgi:hypothetical protein